MISVGIIRKIWKYVVKELNIAGKIVFFLPLLLVISLLGIVSLVEIILFDVLYIAADVVDTRSVNKKYGIADSVWFLMHL